ncbi:MAG: glycosyltransferase [Nitrospirae bacterium]|nr:glycosyltransferase [Nitrospirota bacterium]
MLISLLYFNITGLLASTLLLVFLGHRLKKEHWLLSLILLSAVTGLSHWALIHYLFPERNLSWEWLPAAITGILVIVITEKRWNAFGQLSMTFTLLSGITFLAYAAESTYFTHLGIWSLIFSTVLLALEILAILLMFTHSFEILDVLCRIRWPRTVVPVPATDYFPKVSLHLPAYNEPPEMVIESLNALANLDYPNYEVLVIDNNTRDPAIWKPVEAHCRKLGFKFFHLDNWPGYKSGALNYALTQMAPDTELVGIVDSDYVVKSHYLKDLAGFFKNPKMAFVQTPQDYRGFDVKDLYAKACYDAYQYFFKISMAARNERNSIIFAGTMGLIRASVLKEMGGWDEWCITEDAEISLRILNEGYESIYIDQSYGHGIMPLNIEGLKKQRFRWAFGGMQILRRHWKLLLPRFKDLKTGRQTGLTPGQKYDYLVGGLQWLNDPITLCFSMILLISAGTLIFFQTIFLQPVVGATLYTPFVFILFGVIRFLWALRVRLDITFRQSAAAMMILLGMTWVVSMACLMGLTRKEGTFLRTPKKRGNALLLRSLQISSQEFFLASLCVIASVGLMEKLLFGPSGLLIMGLLLWQAFIYGSAVFTSVWSYQSESGYHLPYAALTSKSTGLRFGNMVTDRSGQFMIAVLSIGFILLLATAVNNVPEKELIYRAKQAFLKEPGYGLIYTPAIIQIKTQILMEEEAALNSNVPYALSLWSHEGIIRDENFTPNDQSDDRVWNGFDAIQKRYIEEYRQRKYLNLVHHNIFIRIEENIATIVNDLSAVIQTKEGLQEVELSRGDQWILKKKGEEWKIVSLTVNRTPK